LARMLHRRDERPARQKVFIAVAAYEGCGAGFTWSLFYTGAALEREGVARELAIYSGNCHVDDSRNRLVRDFLNSDCSDLVFLDADVAWQADDFLKLLAYDRDVVAGVYPKKADGDAYPVKTLPGEIWSDADGLIEVQGVPTGFLRIRRSVLEALAGRAQKYNAKNDGAYSTPCIFERQIHDGTRWGGDYVFCRKWREMGGRIYVDPAMRFEHSGEHTWTGSLGTWLRSRAGIGLKAGLEAIRRGAETAEGLVDLHDAWNNPFAAGPVMLKALAMLARQARGPVLECGSGLSSLVMAAANPNTQVYCLENSPVFAEHLRIEANKAGIANLHIVCRPLKEGWYDIQAMADDWALAVIDGPPMKDANRMEALTRLDLSRAVIVADDVQPDGGVKGMTSALERTHDIAVIECGVKSFAIGAPRKSVQSRAA
jgi:predicted O-methyltransferase YrrM